MRDFFDLLARIFLSAYFLYEAYDSVAFFKSTKTYMAKYGLTWQQDMLIYIGIAFLAGDYAEGEALLHAVYGE